MSKFTLPNTDDKKMWDIWMSLYHLPILSVADKLGLFTKLNNKKLTLEQLANHLRMTPRSIEILVEPLSSLGFLLKKNKKYYLSSTSQIYLIPENPFYWGPILEAQRQKVEYIKIIEAIKEGSNQLLYGNKTFTDMWKEGSLNLEAATHFTRKMHATIFAPAAKAIASGLFKQTKNLLDVGAGSGCFSIAYIKKYPKNKATIFELPIVCEIAKKYTQEFGLTNAIKLHAGNFFDKKSWPIGHDGILLSQILHDWPIQDCKKILEIAYDLLPNGGNIYIHEMLLDKISPLAITFFDLLMFINHKSQQFSKKQLIDLLKSIGFKKIKIEKTFGYHSLAIAAK